MGGGGTEREERERREREEQRARSSEICLLRVGSMRRRARLSPYAGYCDETGVMTTENMCL